MCDLPGPGIERMSPAPAGGFFTPEPPGMPQMVGFDGDGRQPAQCRARTVSSRPSMVSEGEGLPCRPQLPAPSRPGASHIPGMGETHSCAPIIALSCHLYRLSLVHEFHRGSGNILLPFASLVLGFSVAPLTRAQPEIPVLHPRKNQEDR